MSQNKASKNETVLVLVERKQLQSWPPRQLQERPDLNGWDGRVVSLSASHDRYIVQLGVHEHTLKADNIELVKNCT